MFIIDSHIHCGIQNVSQPFRDIRPLLTSAGIQGACLFAPVEDIYYRYSNHFDDNQRWRTCRRQAHGYLLEKARQEENVFAYYFVWNDFRTENLDLGFSGIKWHHHAGEPAYHYQDPACDNMIEAICERRLPVVLEETFDQTLAFLDKIAGRSPVIIPHLGMLNGGFERLLASGIWEDETVFADTALAGRQEMVRFVQTYGHERLLFGSDYPFGEPGAQLQRLMSAGFSDAELERICAENILQLIQQD